MPRHTKRLSNTEIKNAKPRAKEFNLADGDGLYLRVKPNGTKSWLFQYTNPISTRRTNISLGSYPSVTLAEARKQRESCRALLAMGQDPKQYRDNELKSKQVAASNTLQKLSIDWLQTKKTKVTSDYALDIQRALNNHILPILGNRPINDIRVSEFRLALQPLLEANKLETIRRLLQILNQIMEHAILLEITDTNRIRKLSTLFPEPEPINLPTIAPTELPELLSAIKNASINVTTRNLILWQMHTLTRPAEAAGTKWSEIDIENALWIIPKVRMKRRKQHIIPLSKIALQILKEMKPISAHREYVFPGERNPRACINSQTANMALKRMGFKGKLVAHGLRSLGSTTLNEEGFDPQIIEVALSHGDNDKVRAAYNRAEYLNQRREMMEWWSKYILQCMSD